jgi:hypothetical protein
VRGIVLIPPVEVAFEVWLFQGQDRDAGALIPLDDRFIGRFDQVGEVCQRGWTIHRHCIRHLLRKAGFGVAPRRFRQCALGVVGSAAPLGHTIAHNGFERLCLDARNCLRRIAGQTGGEERQQRKGALRRSRQHSV